jgi:sirohydrochlorin cobaltochelatase
MLILVAHGSRDARWRASVQEVVRAIEADLGPGRVLLAYMDHTPPTLMDVATAAVGSGARGLQVLPLFLADEGHVERDVAPLVAQVRAAMPDVEVEQLRSLGRHPEFRAALAAIARRTNSNGGPP